MDITTRSISKAKSKIKKYGLKKVRLIRLNILDKKQILKILKRRYDYIFYFAGQSSPDLSFKKINQTLESNYLGCKNFLEVLKYLNLNTKFFNSSSSEIFSDTKKKLNIFSKKKPISPYGRSKLLSFDLNQRWNCLARAKRKKYLK